MDQPVGRADNKLKRRDCEKIEEIGDFPPIDPQKTKHDAVRNFLKTGL
jgi:ribosomal protein S16